MCPYVNLYSSALYIHISKIIDDVKVFFSQSIIHWCIECSSCGEVCRFCVKRTEEKRFTAFRSWTSRTSWAWYSRAWTNAGKTSSTISCSKSRLFWVRVKALTSISLSYLFVCGFEMNFSLASVPSITNIFFKSMSCSKYNHVTPWASTSLIWCYWSYTRNTLP